MRIASNIALNTSAGGVQVTTNRPGISSTLRKKLLGPKPQLLTLLQTPDATDDAGSQSNRFTFVNADTVVAQLEPERPPDPAPVEDVAVEDGPGVVAQLAGDVDDGDFLDAQPASISQLVDAPAWQPASAAPPGSMTPATSPGVPPPASTTSPVVPSSRRARSPEPCHCEEPKKAVKSKRLKAGAPIKAKPASSWWLVGTVAGALAAGSTGALLGATLGKMLDDTSQEA